MLVYKHFVLLFVVIYPIMAIHIRILNWALIFILRLQFPFGKSLVNTTKKSPIQRKYNFCGVNLEQVDSISYLGVVLSHDLKWAWHVSTITGKVSKVLGMLRRNLWNCPQDIKEIAYMTLVCPKVEYASQAWDPYFKKDIVSIEGI